MDQAPPASAAAVAAGKAGEGPCVRYFQSLGAKYDAAANAGRRRPYRQRRDKGVRRPPEARAERSKRTGAPVTEGDFNRKREAGIQALLQASPEQRRAMRAMGALGPAAIASAAIPGKASATVRAKVLKRSAAGAEMATPEHEAKARKRLDARKWSAFVARQTGDAAGPASPPAGVCLLAGMPGDASIAAFLTKRGFKVTRDAAAFVELCVKMNSTASRKRHLVLAKKGSESDAHVAARLAAMLMGAHFAEAKDFNKNGRACGLKYHVRFNKKEGPVFHAAVSAAMAARLPSVHAVLRYTATRPGSRIVLLAETASRKQFETARRTDEVTPLLVHRGGASRCRSQAAASPRQHR